VSGWLAKILHDGAGDAAEQAADCMLELEPGGGLDRLLLHHELRRRFPTSIWTFDDDDGGFVVMAVSAADRAELEAEESAADLAHRYVDFHRGFSQVVAAIAAAGRPLIGHNCFTDLQLIFHQFVRPLPTDYAAYKRELHALFPVIFDTKQMAAAEAKRRPRQLEAGVNLERLFAALAHCKPDAKQTCPLSLELTEECAR
jgi:poly(A)-specific ribonuclease